MHALLLTAALMNPQSEAQTILKAIDNICGDTWCEGDYSYRFHEVILDAPGNSTRVIFTMSIQYPIKVNAKARILQQRFDVSCNIPGYSTFSGIMTANDRLNWDFYTSLTDCIQGLEGRLSKVNRND